MDSAAQVHGPRADVADPPAPPSTNAPTTVNAAAVIDESVLSAVGAELQPHVAWYTGYYQAGVAPAVHRGLPSPRLTVIFTLDDPVTLISHPDSRQGPASYDALIGGLHTAPAIISHQGWQSGIQLALDPLSARTLLGVPAGELARTVIPADALLGRASGRLREQLGAAATWPERFAVIDRLLPQLARDYGAAPPEVARAWRLLLGTGGRIPIAALAREVGWSERHLSGRFRTEIGLTPKAAARVIRFDRARRLLAPPPRFAPSASTRLADLAADCGYFDQAHLAREFRSLAGCAPTEWVAEEFRNVQAGGSDPAADWS